MVDRKWHVVESKFAEEARALEHLRDQGFKTLLPTYVSRRIVRRHEVSVERPLFSGYLFVAFDAIREEWRRINGTRGVKRLMTSIDGNPVPLRTEEALALVERCEQGPLTEPDVVRILIKPGEEGQIVEGAFSGHFGVCEWIRRNRVGISVMLFGRVETLDMPVEYVTRGT